MGQGHPLNKKHRTAVGIPKTSDILDHIYALPQAEQEQAMTKIRQIEGAAMLKQQPQAGLIELMEYLESRDVRKAICTRNFESEPLSPSYRGTVDQCLGVAHQSTT